MSSGALHRDSFVVDKRDVKPAGLREFSPRAVICGLGVAAVMGASYPYVVLKLGFGPNVSVVAAFFGYLALGLGAVASAALMLMTEDALVLKWFPSVMLVGTAVTMTTGVGINWSLLSLGSGMLVGIRVNASMLIGMILSWVIAPYALLHYG